MPLPDLRDLELVRAIAEAGTLTGASRLLHVTQPAVSQRLAGLQDRLGIAVVERRGGLTALTPAGERLLRTAQRVADELAGVSRDLDALASQQSQQLRIATQCYTCYRWLPFVISRMRGDFPMLNVDVVPEATETPYDALGDGILDIAIISHPQPGYDYEEISLFSDELFAVMHEEHALAKHAVIEPLEFSEQTLILYTGRKHAFVEEVLRPAGVDGYKLIQVRMTEAIIELARSGHGIAVIAGWALDDIGNTDGLVAVRIGRKGFIRDWRAVVGPDADEQHVKSLVRRIKQVGASIQHRAWRKRLQRSVA